MFLREAGTQHIHALASVPIQTLCGAATVLVVALLELLLCLRNDLVSMLVDGVVGHFPTVLLPELAEQLDKSLGGALALLLSAHGCCGCDGFEKGVFFFSSRECSNDLGAKYGQDAARGTYYTEETTTQEIYPTADDATTSYL